MMTEGSVKVFDYMRENYGKEFTAKDIAADLDMSAASVNGAITGLQRKGLAVRTEKEVQVPATIKVIQLTEEGKNAVLAEEASENSKAVLDFLKNNDRDYTAKDIAAELDLGAASVNGVVTGFSRKGYAVRIEKDVMQPSVIKTVSLTEDGLNFDPAEVDAE